MKTLTLVPAYGRDYKSKAAAIADFNSGRDFIICDLFHQYDGKAANRADLVGEYDQVQIRYKRLTQIAVVKLTNPKIDRPRNRMDLIGLPDSPEQSDADYRDDLRQNFLNQK